MLELLLQHTVRAPEAEEVSGRVLANIVHGGAQSGMGAAMGVLFAMLTSTLTRRASELNVQCLANTAWAFATVGQSNKKLFVTLAQVAEPCQKNTSCQTSSACRSSLRPRKRPQCDLHIMNIEVTHSLIRRPGQ